MLEKAPSVIEFTSIDRERGEPDERDRKSVV